MPGQLASVDVGDRHSLGGCPLLGGHEYLVVKMLAWFWWMDEVCGDT